jgi:hypothetical protein
VNDTPRSTWPNFAVRTVENRSHQAGVIASTGSLIVTSLSGSAPVSPPPLTVDLTAQIVAMPSRPTRPVSARKPSVAGDYGPPVTGLMPVG